MKNILITGGCGFIGSNLCKKLIINNNILCIDNLYTGSIENIKDLFNKSNFKFINHDIINKINLEQEIDEIYNCACPASPQKYQNNPINTLDVNYIGTKNLLELAKIKKSKFLQCSTSEIYGDPNISPQYEFYRGNVNTIGPRSCYDEGKRVAETLVIEYNKKYKINTHIVRIFNTYGEFMDKNDGRVVSNFINQMLDNKDITIYGNGTQTRSFCYIDDLVLGMIKLMQSDYIYPINIGNDNEMTINDLVNVLKKLIYSKSKIIYKDLPIDDPKQRKPDISLAKKILNWEPKTNLEEGLKKTISYFKHLKN